MMPHAREYAWFRELFPALAEAYCLTLVQGITPEELLTRFGSVRDGEVRGVHELVQAGYDAWDEHGGDRLLLGVTQVDGWALAVEANGYLGVTDTLIGPVSRGTTLVSHFRNVNAVDHFHWLRDRIELLHFEPLFAHHRDGSEPDRLAGVMGQVGFDLSDADDRDDTLHTESAFALAEHITGVRLTPELLTGADFLIATAAFPTG